MIKAEDTKSNNRDSRFELLRIVAMLMIVYHHCASHAVVNSWGILNCPTETKQVATVLAGIWGQVGVSIFVIISSWFLVDSKGIHFAKWVMIAFQAWLTSMIILVIFYKGNPGGVTAPIIKQEILTPLDTQYWFITTYLAFYLLIPFLQHMVRNIPVDRLGKLVIVLTLVIQAYKLLFPSGRSTLEDFVYLFLATAYLKQREDNLLERYRKLLLTLSCTVFMVGAVLIDLVIPVGDGNIKINLINHLINRNLLTFAIAFSMFYCFMHIRIGYNSWINTIAKTTLGVYIIHENILLRGEGGWPSFLWDGLLKFNVAYNAPGWQYALHFVLCVIMVFLICSLLEWLRALVVDRLLLSRWKFFVNICDRIDVWFRV